VPCQRLHASPWRRCRARAPGISTIPVMPASRLRRSAGGAGACPRVGRGRPLQPRAAAAGGAPVNLPGAAGIGAAALAGESVFDGGDSGPADRSADRARAKVARQWLRWSPARTAANAGGVARRPARPREWTTTRSAGRSRSWAENVLQELGSPPGRSYELPGSGAASGADYAPTIAEQPVNSKRPHPGGQSPRAQTRAQAGGPAPSGEPKFQAGIGRARSGAGATYGRRDPCPRGGPGGPARNQPGPANATQR